LDEKTGKSYLFFLIEDKKKSEWGKRGWEKCKKFFLLPVPGFKIQYYQKKVGLYVKTMIQLSLIRFVLRTEILTQEKRMFYIAFFLEFLGG
jgi:hypothetical protein